MRKSHAPTTRRSNRCSSDGAGPPSDWRSSKMTRSWAHQLVGRSGTPLRMRPISVVLSTRIECHLTMSCSLSRDQSRAGVTLCGTRPPRRSCSERPMPEIGGWALVTIPCRSSLKRRRTSSSAPSRVDEVRHRFGSGSGLETQTHSWTSGCPIRFTGQMKMFSTEPYSSITSESVLAWCWRSLARSPIWWSPRRRSSRYSSAS